MYFIFTPTLFIEKPDKPPPRIQISVEKELRLFISFSIYFFPSGGVTFFILASDSNLLPITQSNSNL